MLTVHPKPTRYPSHTPPLTLSLCIPASINYCVMSTADVSATIADADEDDGGSDDSDIPDLEPVDTDTNGPAKKIPENVSDVGSAAKKTATELSADAASLSVVSTLLTHPATRLQCLSVARCGIADFSPSSARHFVDRSDASSVLERLFQ